jgi:mRNA interferase MazF
VSARRGEVWLVNLEPVVGHEQGRVRPALVLSQDVTNAATQLATILPITSKARAVRTRVPVQPPEAGLTLLSYAICEQPRTISEVRFRQRLGVASPATMLAVENVARVLLGL